MRTCAANQLASASIVRSLLGDEFVQRGSSLLLGGGFAEQQRAGVEVPDAGLRIEIELADRLDLVVEKLDAHRQRVMKGEDIEDAAAHRVLAARGDLRARARSPPRRAAASSSSRSSRVAATERKFELLAARRARGLRRRDCARVSTTICRPLRAGQLLHDAQPLRDGLRIGQRAFDRRALDFGKKSASGNQWSSSLCIVSCARISGQTIQTRAFACRASSAARKGCAAANDVLEGNRLPARRARQLRRERRAAAI